MHKICKTVGNILTANLNIEPYLENNNKKQTENNGKHVLWNETYKESTKDEISNINKLSNTTFVATDAAPDVTPDATPVKNNARYIQLTTPPTDFDKLTVSNDAMQFYAKLSEASLIFTAKLTITVTKPPLVKLVALNVAAHCVTFNGILLSRLQKTRF